MAEMDTQQAMGTVSLTTRVIKVYLKEKLQVVSGARTQYSPGIELANKPFPYEAPCILASLYKRVRYFCPWTYSTVK